MLRESRLVGYTASQLKGMGVTDTTTQYNTRTAEANAFKQQQATANKINQSVLPYYGNDVPTNVIPTYDQNGNTIPWAPTQIGISQGPQVAQPTSSGPSLYDQQTTQKAGATGQQTTMTQSVGTNGQIVQSPIAPVLPKAPSPTVTTTQKADKAAADAKAQLRNAGIDDPTVVIDAQNKARQAVSDETARLNQLKNDELARQKAQQDLQNSLIQANQPAPATPSTTDNGTILPHPGIDTAKYTNPAVNPDVSAAFDALNQALNSADTASAAQAAQKITSLLSDTSVADAAAQSKTALTDFVNKQQDLTDRSHDQALARETEIKTEQTNALASAKAKFELDQALQESQQRQKNIDDELKNRRAAAALGVTHDTNGLHWMAEEERKGNELLSYLVNSGNIQEASFAEQARSIGEQYRLGTQQADLQYDSQNLSIEQSFKSALSDIDKTVSLDARDRNKQIQDTIQKFVDEKSANDIKRAENQKDIRIETLRQIADAEKQKTAEELADKRLQYQENQATIRQQNLLDRQDQQQARQDQRLEFQEKNQATQKTLSMQNSINTLVNVKDYRESAIRAQTASDLFTKYQNGEIKNFGDVQEAVGVFYEKLLDPNSVVREGEFNRIAENSGLRGKFQQIDQFLKSGGRGLSEQDVSDLISVMNKATQVRRDTIMTQILPPYYNTLDEWNANTFYDSGKIDPSSVFPPEFLPKTDKTSSAADRLLNGDFSSPSDFLSSPPPPKVDSVQPPDLVSYNIAGKDVHAQPYLVSALAKADQDMFAATGQHLKINESYRDPSRQSALYTAYQNGSGVRAAPPGKSFHEKGLAVDVQNWQQAAPYLAKYGVVNGLKDDMNHFSIGELNPDYIAQLSKQLS